MCAVRHDPLRVVEALESDTTEERKVKRKVRAQGEGEAMDVGETKNGDTGVDAEGEDIVSPRRCSAMKEWREKTYPPTLVASVLASASTP